MDSSFNLAVHALVCLSHCGRSLSSEALAENICTNPTRVRDVYKRQPEGRKVCTHEPGEIHSRAQKRRRQRIPAVAGKPFRNAASRR